MSLSEEMSMGSPLLKPGEMPSTTRDRDLYTTQSEDNIHKHAHPIYT